MLEHGRQMGERVGDELDRMAKRLGGERVVEARGEGLLRAIELTSPVAPVVERCRQEGVLVITAGEKILRLAPPW